MKKNLIITTVALMMLFMSVTVTSNAQSLTAKRLQAINKLHNLSIAANKNRVANIILKDKNNEECKRLQKRLSYETAIRTRPCEDRVTNYYIIRIETSKKSFFDYIISQLRKGNNIVNLKPVADLYYVLDRFVFEDNSEFQNVIDSDYKSRGLLKGKYTKETIIGKYLYDRLDKFKSKEKFVLNEDI